MTKASDDTLKIETFHTNGALLKTFTRCGVEFLIVGGVAVYHYRCRMYDDLDLMVGPTLENGEKLVEACTQLGQPPSEWTAKTIAEPGLKILRMKSVHYADIVTPPEGVDFASLHARSGPIKVNGQACRVISKSDLIEMKRLAIKTIEAEARKHRDDLECLERR
jgi:hypothetical protein